MTEQRGNSTHAPAGAPSSAHQSTGALQHRRTGQAEKAEHGHKRLEPLAAVSLKVKPLVVEKALAREEPGPALMHVALNALSRKSHAEKFRQGAPIEMAEPEGAERAAA